MFDCPEQNHTSPINMSLSTILFLPIISMLYGPPAFMGVSCNIHLPLSSVFVLYDLLFHFTVTFSPFDAHPQIFIFISLCITILSLIILGNFICAFVLYDANKAK